MDTGSLIVLIMVIFALIILAAFVIFPNVRARITGPFKTGLDVEGSHGQAEPQATNAEAKAGGPAIDAEGITSREGGIVADDQTGRGLRARDFDAKDDVLLGSSDPKKEPPPT